MVPTSQKLCLSHFTKLLYVFYSSRCSTPKPCTSKIYEMWNLEAQPDLLNMQDLHQKKKKKKD